MVKELIFHLGDRKTGSTAIQEALVRGDITCPGKTLLFPSKSNHIPLAKTLSTASLANERPARFSKIAKRLAGSDADIAILSAEHFEVVDPVVLRQTIATFFPDLQDKIRLIAYVRPHAERLVSNYAEQIKLGQFSGTLEAFHQQRLAEKPLHYTERFSHWRDTFGDAFALRPFIRSTLHSADIVQDFAQFLFGDAPFSVRPSPPSNTSMTLEDLSVMQAFHSQLPNHPGLTKFKVATGKKMGKLMAAHPGETGTRLKLHKTLAEEIKQAYSADAAAFDAAFFAPATPMQDALQTACDTAIETAQSIAPETCLSPATQRVVSAWAGMIRDMGTTDAQTLTAMLQSGAKDTAHPSDKGPKGPRKGKSAGKGAGKGKRGRGRKKPPQHFNENDLFDLI